MDLADEIYEMRDITYDEQITHLVGIVGQYSMQMTQNVKVDVVFSWKVLNLEKKNERPFISYSSVTVYIIFNLKTIKSLYRIGMNIFNFKTLILIKFIVILKFWTINEHILKWRFFQIGIFDIPLYHSLK